MRWLIAGWVITFLVFAPAVARGADAATGKAAAKTLLEKGWAKTAAAREAVDQPELDEAPLKDDAFLLAARWLVLLHQNRFDDGLTVVDKFLETQPSHLVSLRAKTWANTVKRDYRQAMVAADQLSQAASRAAGNGGQAANPAVDAELEFLGRMVGFLEGPMEKNADQVVRQKLEARVLERCDEHAKKVFNDAKNGVLDHYKELVAEAAAAKGDTDQSTQVLKEQKLGELSDKAAKLSVEANKLEDQTTKLQEDFKNRLAELDRQQAPLMQRQMFLQGQITTLSTQLNQQQTLLAQYAQQTANADSKNSNRNAVSNGEILRAQNAVATLRGQLEIANNQLGLTQVALVNIQQQRIATGGAANMQGQQLENMRQGVQRDKQKNEAKQKKAEKAKPAANVKLAALENEARTYATYESFPFEELRENLLKRAR